MEQLGTGIFTWLILEGGMEKMNHGTSPIGAEIINNGMTIQVQSACLHSQQSSQDNRLLPNRHGAFIIEFLVVVALRKTLLD